MSSEGPESGKSRLGGRVGIGTVASWCAAHLGAEAAEELFRAGYLSGVVGIRLMDGRDVVVKVRETDARLAACFATQRHLFAGGFPCPEPLVEPRPLSGALVCSAESHVPGGSPLPESGRHPLPFARWLARLVSLAPPPESVGTLAPAPPWTTSDFAVGGPWPPPDDIDLDLNAVDGPPWLDAAAIRLGHRLRARTGPRVVGHGDWCAGNVAWQGNDLLVAHDWDSVISDCEAVLAGLSAAQFAATKLGMESTTDEMAAFFEAYGTERGRLFSRDEDEISWAAAAWLRLFDAKKYVACPAAYGARAPATSAAHAREWLRRAGA